MLEVYPFIPMSNILSELFSRRWLIYIIQLIAISNDMQANDAW